MDDGAGAVDWGEFRGGGGEGLGFRDSDGGAVGSETVSSMIGGGISCGWRRQ